MGTFGAFGGGGVTWFRLGVLLGTSWAPLGASCASQWPRHVPREPPRGRQESPKGISGPLKKCPESNRNPFRKAKLSFYEGFVHVGFPAPEAPRIVKKRSGPPPEASGSTIFGQNRHFTRVLARSRLLTISLPNVLFKSVSYTHLRAPRDYAASRMPSSA